MLLSCVLAVLISVTASARLRKPNTDFTPVSAFVLTRHGARSPYLSIPGLTLDTWTCDFSLFQYPGIAPTSPSVAFDGQLYRKNYIPNQQALPGNCSQGQLTQTGALMLQDTGKWLRDVLGDLVPETWDPKTCYARSTDIDRTYESAENLLKTLFKAPSEVSSTADVLNIWTVEKGYDMVDVAQNMPCPALKATCNAIVESAAWQQHKASIAPLQAKLAQAFNVPAATMPDIAASLEVLRARSAQGLPLVVDEATYLEVEKAASWELRALYNNLTVHQFTSGQLAEEMVSILRNAQGGSGRLFTLFSAHDTTVAPLLSVLNVNWTTWPNYASNLLLTLGVDSTGAYYVNLMHDRKPVQMGECALNCPWDSFVDMVGQSFISNRNQRCQAAPKGVDTTFAEDPEVGFLC